MFNVLVMKRRFYWELAPECGTGGGLSGDTGPPGNSSRWIRPPIWPLCTAISTLKLTQTRSDTCTVCQYIFATNTLHLQILFKNIFYFQLLEWDLNPQPLATRQVLQITSLNNY